MLFILILNLNCFILCKLIPNSYKKIGCELKNPIKSFFFVSVGF